MEGFYLSLFLFSAGLNDISVKCKDTAASVTDHPCVSATYDTVNNLHYKAHSWKESAQQKSHNISS